MEDWKAKAWQLPHTANCVVCGRTNPHGLRLDLFVLPETGLVIAEFVPQPHHVGFESLVHGGVLATVLDEAMTWAATWVGKRFCVCGEMSLRLRQGVRVGERLRIEALVDYHRHKLVEPSAKLFDEYHKLLATASGRYVPVSPEQHGDFVKTFIDAPQTRAAADALGLHRQGATEERHT